MQFFSTKYAKFYQKLFIYFAFLVSRHQIMNKSCKNCENFPKKNTKNTKKKYKICTFTETFGSFA